jgi:predicted dinucleotide-binding enzyme
VNFVHSLQIAYEIVIIGSGNVASVLGRKFKAAGHEIIQVLSRNAKAASQLAYDGIQKAPIIPALLILMLMFISLQ